MPGTTRLAAMLALAAAVAALSACGSNEIGGQIPQADADQLKASLSQVRSDVSNGQCDGAASEAQAFVDGVNSLPETATAELKAALRTAGEKLLELVSQECPATGTTGLTGEQPTTGATTSTDTTTGDTTSTDTTSTDTTSTDTTTTTGTRPQDNGKPGGGGGGGSDTGGGGGPGDGGTGGTGGGA
jgi:FIMAH domain-containing protein